MLIKKIKKLPRELLDFIHLASSLARKNNYKAFLVGGFVRDLMLGVANFDVDIVIEGDGIDFARLLTHKLKVRLIQHQRFGTATVITPDKFKIDIATARRESYEHPASLPRVEFGSIKDDLARRDFTINALAIDINGNNFGQVIDFFNSQQDLRNKKIRVLHEKSFIDDPTRILRAIRFEQRYNFQIEPHTLKLLKDAVNLKMLNLTQAQRLRDELMLVLKEQEPIKCIRRINTLCKLSFIHSHLHFNKRIERLLYSIQRHIEWFRINFPKRRLIDSWLMYFIGLLDNVSVKDSQNIDERFAFRKGNYLRIVSYKKGNLDIIKKLSRNNISASDIYRILEPLSYEVIILILAKSEDKVIRLRIKEFITRYNGIRIFVTGKDLSDLGLTAGPEFKKILTKVLYAKINGKVHTKQQELGFLKRQIK